MDVLSYAFYLGSGDDIKTASEEDQYNAGFAAGVISFLEDAAVQMKLANDVLDLGLDADKKEDSHGV